MSAPARHRALFKLLISALLLCAGVVFYRLNAPSTLPYGDSFALGHAEEWHAFGGNWEIADGAMRNASNERGAKLVTGQTSWRDVSVEADVMLLGSDGDAGLIIRSSDEEEGVNAYTGYYAGLRNSDNSFVFGRAQQTWNEAKRLSTGVRIAPLQWYHVRVLAFGCELFAAVSLAGGPPLGMAKLNEQNCIPKGRIGLRSYSSGGEWKNVKVQVATAAEARAMSAQVDQWTATHKGLARGGFVAAAPDTTALNHGSVDESALPPLQPIGDLRLAPHAAPVQVRIRGAVILTSPSLFLQDATGGVEITGATSPPLKAGDVVEAVGTVHPDDFGATLDHATLRVLWAHTPVPALSVTPLQAATGAFNDSFVEVEGRLVARHDRPHGSQVLDLVSGAQAFQAILERNRNDPSWQDLQVGSVLRLRGVSVVGRAYTHYLTPFVLLLRSSQDLTIVSGPPWWNAAHFLAVVVGVLAFGAAINLLYNRAERWKLRAVFNERERLAQEMHDTLAQSFAGIGFQLEAIRGGTPEELTVLHQQLDLATHLVRHSHEEARRSIAALRPESLESGDLVAALTFCAERMVCGGDMQVEVHCTGEPGELPLPLLETLYRIGQEALANSVAHSDARLIRIRLLYTAEQVGLSIQDNGKGFVPSRTERGLGLSGMRKRAHNVSAAIEITSEPGRGTQVEVTAPLARRPGYFSNLRKALLRQIPHDTDGTRKHSHPDSGRSSGRSRRARQHAEHTTSPEGNRLSI